MSDEFKDAKDLELCSNPNSYCNRDRKNNMWVEGEHANEGGGICLLDTWTRDQVIYTLEHNPNAAEHLRRVTSDPDLLELANTVKLLSTGVEADELQSDINRNKELESYPFYGIFRGQPPFNQ